MWFLLGFSQSMLGSKKAGRNIHEIFVGWKIICTVQRSNKGCFFKMFNQEKKHQQMHDQKLRLEEARDILYHNQQLGWEVMEWLGGYLLVEQGFIQVQVIHPHPVSKFIGLEWMEDEIGCHPRWFGSSPRGVMFHFRKSKSKGRLETIRLLLLWIKIMVRQHSWQPKSLTYLVMLVFRLRSENTPEVWGVTYYWDDFCILFNDLTWLLTPDMLANDPSFS